MYPITYKWGTIVLVLDALMNSCFDANIGAVDLFCGAGGLTVGLAQGGIDVRLGIDIDPHCRYPYESNNGTRFLLKSVQKLSAADLESAWRGTRYRLLAGCAPCQPFSTYAQKKRSPDDARWGLLGHYRRIVEETQPDLLTMENVPALVKMQIFADFMETLRCLGYKVWYSVVACSQYGVPQTRKRLVLLGSRLGPVSLPVESMAPVSVRQTIGHLPPIAAGQHHPDDPLHRSCRVSETNLARLRAARVGGSWRDWPEELRAACHGRKTGCGYVSVYGRMEWDAPAPTMTTQFYGFGNGRFGHPEQDRAISLREGALLQGFPADYRFVEDGTRIYTKIIGRLIGNAVPVALAKRIGEAFVAHVQDIDGSLSSSFNTETAA